jgi:multiple sugar transport system permease protein
VPVYLVLIPLFQLGAAAGQLNTHQFVVLVLVSASLPLAIWILRSHIASLPLDIEAAATLDGADTFELIRDIIGPLIAPGLVAAAVIVFLASWGAFLIPLVYAGTQGAQPLTVVIPTFATRFSGNYGLQASAGLLAIVPPLLLVVVLRRHLLSGLISGAVK